MQRFKDVLMQLVWDCHLLPIYYDAIEDEELVLDTPNGLTSVGKSFTALKPSCDKECL